MLQCGKQALPAARDGAITPSASAMFRLGFGALAWQSSGSGPAGGGTTRADPTSVGTASVAATSVGATGTPAGLVETGGMGCGDLDRRRPVGRGGCCFRAVAHPLQQPTFRI